MRVFARLSAAEADQAERGALRGEFVWVDNPQTWESDEASAWVAIDVPDNRMGKFERRVGSRVDRREFLLPARMTNLHRAERVLPPD